MKKSWKTTAAGALAALGGLLVATAGFFEVNSGGFGGILFAAGSFLTAYFARDDDVSSEGARASKAS